MGPLVTTLNPEQARAAAHDDGPLLIIAGAGSGKTTTLAHRVAQLIAGGTHPGRILLLTFARRAAAEMLRRVDGILQRGAAVAALASGQLWGGTFHAIATRLLRLHGEAIGLSPDFTILDRADSEDLLDVVRAELGLASSERRFPRKSTCLEIYSRSVSARVPLDRLLATAYPFCREHQDDLKRLFRTYVDRKAEHAILDYDDLLLFLHGLLADPVAGAAVRRRFDRVLVDEYQDTNALQAEILDLIRPDGRGITVVGDDAQAIYSFRGATVRNILDFPRHHPGATVIALEQNYRSTPALVEATNRVIAAAAERHEKRLFSRRPPGDPPSLVTCRDEDEQSAFLVRTILEHREGGTPLRKQAVLFRTAHHSLALELELAHRGIPFHKYGGLKFVEAAHVKDVTAFLRLVENPRDLVAGTRALLLLPAIGPRRARQLLDPPPAPGERFARWAALPAPSPAWPGFVALLQDLSGPDAPDLPSQLQRIRGFYAPLVEERYDHFAARVRDLEQLEQIATRFTDRRTFLADLALDPPASTQELAGPPLIDEDYLILSTIHSAKGLEWDAVYLLHAADGCIPSDMATGSADEIEEERRLFYVAATRARDHLYVCFPLRYYHRPSASGGKTDGHGYAQLTRFLPAEVRSAFAERRGAEPSASIEVIDSSGSGPGAIARGESIRKQIRDFWS